jgi:hypothetical protein
MMAMEYHMIPLRKVGHMNERYKETATSEQDCNGMDGSAETIIDMEGRLLYYNRQAAKILDRKKMGVRLWKN